MFNYKITIGGVEFKDILLETLALAKYDYEIRYFFVSYDGVPTRPVRLLFNKGFKTKEAAEEYFKKLVEETARLAELKAEYGKLTHELLNSENISDSRDDYIRKCRIDIRAEIKRLVDDLPKFDYITDD